MIRVLNLVMVGLSSYLTTICQLHTHHFGDLIVDGRTTLRLVLRKCVVRSVHRIYLAQIMVV
jgi:hypothetical protein